MNWYRLLSMVGLVCSSACVLGFSLLALWLSALGLGWLVDDRIMQGMLLMFLGMYVTAAWHSSRHHGHRETFWISLIGCGLLVATAWHALPHAAAWIGSAWLLLCWFWDQRLLRLKPKTSTHAGSKEHHEFH
jgi:hypothetical protein